MRLLKREQYVGLFAKLNSGATNSVGGMSKRSDADKGTVGLIPALELASLTPAAKSLVL